MKKNDSFVTENATNEKRVVLNGVEMERDEHNGYKEVEATNQSMVLPITAFCSAIVAIFLAIASVFSCQTNHNLTASRKANAAQSISWGSGIHSTESAIESDICEKTDSNTYTLTIRYIGPSGEELCPPTQREMKANDTYSIVSPSIEGYTANSSSVSGILGDSDQSRDIEYGKDQD